MVVPTNLNPVSVMEFNWRNLIGENVSFSRSLLVLTYSKPLRLLDAVFFFMIVTTVTGPFPTWMGAQDTLVQRSQLPNLFEIEIDQINDKSIGLTW